MKALIPVGVFVCLAIAVVASAPPTPPTAHASLVVKQWLDQSCVTNVGCEKRTREQVLLTHTFAMTPHQAMGITSDTTVVLHWNFNEGNSEQLTLSVGSDPNYRYGDTSAAVALTDEFYDIKARFSWEKGQFHVALSRTAISDQVLSAHTKLLPGNDVPSVKVATTVTNADHQSYGNTATYAVRSRNGSVQKMLADNITSFQRSLQIKNTTFRIPASNPATN